MASNFACEAVQRSAGTEPKYLYAPAPEGTAELFGGVTTALNVVVQNATGLSLLPIFPTGTNGMFLIDCVTTNPVYSISSTGVVFDYAGAGVTVLGFNNVNTAAGGASEVALSSSTSDVQIYQNSGGPLTYSISILKIASVQIA